MSLTTVIRMSIDELYESIGMEDSPLIGNCVLCGLPEDMPIHNASAGYVTYHESQKESISVPDETDA